MPENKLIHEKSPYLLQHAHNPVNWYPWGAEAFDKAKQENKPIFLSIGYSTCHWCHVMAHESFEDREVAAILNEHYIAIKVDREERPDIDSVYMKVCQMMTGRGGWPLTIVMTPEKVPFFAGTYYPRMSKGEMPGLLDILPYLAKQFAEKPEDIAKTANEVKQALQQTVQQKSTHRLSLKETEQAYQQLARAFDEEFGGFGPAPKFPAPHRILFMLQKAYYDHDEEALAMAEHTLESMAAGGIWDHVGFGFCRYSTDQAWLVPHFEKMLYDNALLLLAYTEAYQLTGQELYEEVAEQIIDFVLHEMRGSEGVFYSGIDADSEGVEGKYYVWTRAEIMELLGDQLGSLYVDSFDITEAGNFEGKNIPNRIFTDWDAVAEKYGLDWETLDEQLEMARVKLREARKKRVYPHVDDKVLTSWNALMVVGLARAGKVFGNAAYLQAARQALQFIKENMFQNGRLMARYRDGEVRYPAYLDDYAFLLWAYVEMYEADFETDDLIKAKNLAEEMDSLFWDEIHGGYYFSGSDAEELISREKEIYDGAIPSGNSVATLALSKLSALTGDPHYQDRVEEMYYSFYADVADHASASAFFMMALMRTEHPSKEVVVLGDQSDPVRDQIVNTVQRAYLPEVSMLAAEKAEHLLQAAPFAGSYKKSGEQTTIYVCENFACKQPTTDARQALDDIMEK